MRINFLEGGGYYFGKPLAEYREAKLVDLYEIMHKLVEPHELDCVCDDCKFFLAICDETVRRKSAPVPEFVDTDVVDLRRVNWLAKADWKKKDFCYRIKDILLNRYSEFDGYDLQEFTRGEWDEDWDGRHYSTGNTFSWHRHILERRLIAGAVFHRPTDHFRYSDINEHRKQSKRFVQMLAVCRTNKIEGTHEAPEGFDKQSGVRALRRLVHKFKRVIRRELPKPARAAYPFLKKDTWMSGEFRDFRVRVPAPVACLGCGSKLVARVSSWDLLKIKLGVFEKLRNVHCDYYGDWKRDCPESTKQSRYEMRSYDREPGYQEETEIVSKWAREFFAAHMDEFTEALGLAEFFEENAHEFIKEEAQ